MPGVPDLFIPLVSWRKIPITLKTPAGGILSVIAVLDNYICTANNVVFPTSIHKSNPAKSEVDSTGILLTVGRIGFVPNLTGRRWRFDPLTVSLRK